MLAVNGIFRGGVEVELLVGCCSYVQSLSSFIMGVG